MAADQVVILGVCAPGVRDDHLLRPHRSAPIFDEA